MLQAKLHSQEEDFRLQNSTLMAEFSKLCNQMEQLELENQQLKDGASRAGAPQAGSVVDGELLRLQAENTALQKNVAGVWRPSWGPWGLSRMFSSWGKVERLQNQAWPCHEPQHMTLDKPFHLSEPKPPHLQSVYSDVHPLGDCKRDKSAIFLSLVQCLVPNRFYRLAN
uniref:GRIP1 associated protein 1 n=1 Tax=Molossus molossus TaxID=27622 RepID=A0A7J8J674_MOLMO|nr:GRIP1 associated protein 1 [Molossus molossus]